MMEMAIARPKIIGPNAAPNITTFGRVFDFDDLSTHIGKQHGPERPGAILLNRQNGHAIQR
jgi:hypothetical protein